MDLPPLEASSLHICYYALENMTEHNMGLPTDIQACHGSNKVAV
jgi:hypothetical protein